MGLDILSWQKLRNGLPSWLPAGTKVAHKTGTGVRNQHDAGIIYFGDQPRFILMVYTEHLPGRTPQWPARAHGGSATHRPYVSDLL